MNKSILRASAALQALALLGAGATVMVAAPAAAQDYTSGILSGTVTNASGAPVAGASVTVTSNEQGSTQTGVTNANGVFSFSNLPVGNYDVNVNASGNREFTATAVSVVSGRTTSIPVTLTAGTAEAGNAIVVLGRRIQAFSGTTTGLNVDVAQVTKIVPVERSLTSVILMAAGTTKGDAAFGNLASINGASVAENAYYINGLNITNFDNYLGSATVPFDFYKSVEVKSGGYPAEFGRATGGIVNATTKAGTNDWIGAAHLNWSPEFLRDDTSVRNICTTPACGPEDITDLAGEDYDKSLSATVELGGPIFRDRLFVYGLVQFQRHLYRTVVPAAATAYTYRNDDPFWGAKVDAYPIDSQHLEFTIFDTRNTTHRDDIAFAYDADGNPTYGLAKSAVDFHHGGVNYVGKYTGRFTNFLTVSGAYGRMQDRYDFKGVAGAAGEPAFRNLTGATYAGVPYGGYFTDQTLGSFSAPHSATRKFWRGDADLMFNAFGRHHVRFGIDHEDDILKEVTVRTGNGFLCSNGYLTTAACQANGGQGGVEYFLNPAAGANPLPQVELNYYNSGGEFTQKNTAIYLEDEWKPTDRLTVNAGVRRDNFEVTDAAGNSFATLKNNWSPRIGVTYDLFPDRSGQIKAFYGTYYLPFASNTAFRNVGGEVYFSERYYLGGFDANGLPILGPQVTDNGSYQAACPFQLSPQGSGQNCRVTGTGKVPESDTVISHNLKATLQSEYILGYQQKWRGWTFGLTATYRKLIRESEDSAIDAAALAYCAANGLTDVVNPDTGYTCGSYYTGYAQYVINNPGFPIVVNLAGVQGQPEVTLSPEDLGYPKAKRTYKALEFTFDRPYDGVWSLGGSYTLSKSKGNSEGFVQSDFGQSDAGITQDFDQPGFIPGAYGYLPNDRRHRIKVYGAYTLWHKLTLGANVDIESPRHLSCFGFNPYDVFANGYGAASHYCNGVLSPRGTAQRSDWLKQVNAKVAYELDLANNVQILLHADVFNLFNGHAALAKYEFGDLDVGAYDPVTNLPLSYIPDPSYGLPTVYQAPRYVRLGMDISFGGAAPPPPPPPVVAPPPPPPPAPPPATQTCADGSVILATDTCPAPPPPPPPPAPAPERGL